MAVLRKLCALLVVNYFHATKPFHYSLFNVLLYAMYDFIMSTIFATMKIFSWMMQKERTEIILLGSKLGQLCQDPLVQNTFCIPGILAKYYSLKVRQVLLT